MLKTVDAMLSVAVPVATCAFCRKSERFGVEQDTVSEGSARLVFHAPFWFFTVRGSDDKIFACLRHEMEIKESLKKLGLALS